MEESDGALQPRDLQNTTPDSTLQDTELQDAIQKAIDQLPEVQRMAVLMRRYEEFSYEEIAEVLQITVPAVKSVLFRARTDLREHLQRYLKN